MDYIGVVPAYIEKWRFQPALCPWKTGWIGRPVRGPELVESRPARHRHKQSQIFRSSRFAAGAIITAAAMARRFFRSEPCAISQLFGGIFV